MVERAALFDAWDEVFNAAQRVETALPFQMSEAIASLEAARKNMRAVLQSWATTSDADLHRQLSEAVERAEKTEREVERLTPLAVAYDYLESPAGREIAEAEVARLREALEPLERHVALECYDRLIEGGWEKSERLSQLLDGARAALLGEPSVPLNEQALVEAIDALQGEPKP